MPCLFFSSSSVTTFRSLARMVFSFDKTKRTNCHSLSLSCSQIFISGPCCWSSYHRYDPTRRPFTNTIIYSIFVIFVFLLLLFHSNLQRDNEFAVQPRTLSYQSIRLGKSFDTTRSISMILLSPSCFSSKV